jgi:uncharacterized protein DUF4339
VAWYVARDGQTWGPAELEQLRQAATSGELLPDDLVWQDGMDGWKPASSVSALWPAKSADSGEPRAAPKAARRTRLLSWANFALRHWRGEFSLRTAYWLFGFAGMLVGLAALKGIVDFALVPPRAAGVAGAYIALLALSVLVLSIWQVVGVWRSSSRYVRDGGRRNWAGLARVGVLFGALQLAIGSYSILAPLALDLPSPGGARGGQTESGDRLRLLPARGEIELVGKVSFGTSVTFSQFLTAAPKLKRVRSDARGGVVDEAATVAALIKEHGLETYTSIDCVGVCTIIFLAGSKRYVTKGARLGFHDLGASGLLDRVVGATSIRSVTAILRSLDAPSWFLDKVARASATNPWYPSYEQLVAARIIHGVIEATESVRGGPKAGPGQ